MKKIKVLALFLFSIIFLLGFSNAYLIDKNITVSAHSTHSLGDISSVSCVSPSGQSFVSWYEGTDLQGQYINCPFTKNFSSLQKNISIRNVSDNLLSFSYPYYTDTLELSELGFMFSPVITGLTNSVNEFIPYVVYVGLGVLGVLIGFVAIRWLMNYLGINVLNPFRK